MYSKSTELDRLLLISHRERICNILFEKNERILQWIIMASLAYVCFVPAKGLIRDLSANSSNIAFEVPLASK